MKVNDTCTGCEACLPYCPQGAIHMTEEAQAAVDRELCVECGVCIDPDICPVAAFEEDQDETAKFKRSFGRLLSKHLDRRDVVKDSPYDVKTNDVTAKIPKNKVVMRLELNRPGGGLTFRDVQQMGAEMQQLGWNLDISSRTLNLDRIRGMAAEMGLRIDSFQIDLGTIGNTHFDGATEGILSLCGHMRVSENLIKEMREKVKAGEADPETAAREIGKVCLCGCFNPYAAGKLLTGDVK